MQTLTAEREIAANQTSNAQWMSGGWGIMVHWIYPTILPEGQQIALSLDEAVDGFDLARFLDEFEQSGAHWLIWTIGQNTGFYCSPNSVLERLAGAGHASQRDLTLEVARGVKALGKRFIAYMPAEMAFNDALKNAFEWNEENAPIQMRFQKNYCDFLFEYSMRLGELLDGWWMDGTWIYPLGKLDFELWSGALRAGNPRAALAFNNGGFTGTDTQPMHAECDFLPGETDVLIDGKIRVGRTPERVLMLPQTPFSPGTNCLWHALVPLDCPWGFGFDPAPVEVVPDSPYETLDRENPSMPAPLYRDEDLRSFLAHCTQIGGAVTWNVGIYREGHLAPQTLAQIQRVAV